MKIARIVLAPFELPLRRPLVTGHGTLARRAGILLTLVSETGVQGFGEASPLAGFGTEGLEAAPPRWLGEDPLEPGRLERGAPPAQRPCARAAFETALLDLRARAREESLCRMLAADEPATSVAVNALLSDVEPSALARSAREAVDQGFRALKLKLVGPQRAHDLARVAAVRDAVGGGVALRLDLNATLDEAGAIALGHELARFDPEYLEQPVAADDLHALARVRRSAPIRIAADEAVRDRARARAIVQAEAADVLIVKPSLCGGWSETCAIATEARAAGLEVVVTHAFESAIGSRAALHAAASLGTTGIHGLAVPDLLSDDLAPRTKPVAGTLRVPDAPGLGLDPVPDALARLRTGPGREFAL